MTETATLADLEKLERNLCRDDRYTPAQRDRLLATVRDLRMARRTVLFAPLGHRWWAVGEPKAPHEFRASPRLDEGLAILHLAAKQPFTELSAVPLVAPETETVNESLRNRLKRTADHLERHSEPLAAFLRPGVGVRVSGGSFSFQPDEGTPEIVCEAFAGSGPA